MPDLRRLGELYQISSRVTRNHGGNLFFAAGTLLGLERTGGWIPDDDDVDTAFVSWAGPDRAPEQLTQIGEQLNRIGYDAHVSTPMKTHLHVHHPDDYLESRIDVFFHFFHRGILILPAGVTTQSGEIIQSTWRGTESASFEGIPGRKPVQTREYLEHIYGPDWETPMTGYSWSWVGQTFREDLEHRLTRKQVRRVEESRRPEWRGRRDCEKR